MPTTVNSDLIIYDDLAQTAFLERRQDNLAIFNASSNGAILLDNELIEGDFRKRAFYKVGGSIESRDVNSTEKVTGKKIGAGEAVSVKAPWKYGPYETTEEAFKRRGRSVDEFSEVIGTDVADATLEGYVKYGLKALTAAIGANADMVVTADIETDGKKTLTRGLRKYGDKFNALCSSLCTPPLTSTSWMKRSPTKSTKKRAWWFTAGSRERWVSLCWLPTPWTLMRSLGS